MSMMSLTSNSFKYLPTPNYSFSMRTGSLVWDDIGYLKDLFLTGKLRNAPLS